MALNKTFTGVVVNLNGGIDMSFSAIAAKGIYANATNASAVPAVLAGSAAFQYLRVNSANNALEWATLSGHASTSVTYTSDQFQRAALTGAIAASANSNATLFAGIRDNGAAENDRTNLNFVNSTSINAVVTDDAGNDELEISYQRAALTGAISASANSNSTEFSGLRVNGALQTARGFINILDTNTIAWTPNDDAANNENEWRANFRFGNIRDNGSLETARSILNFVNNDAIELTVTQDAGNDELELTATYVGSTSEVTIASATGNLGTINIAALACGGSVRVTSASSAYSIEGFTAKPNGFWFDFLTETGLTNHCTLFDEDATATATNRLSLPRDTDMLEQPQVRGRFTYRNSRWHFTGANQMVVGRNSTDYLGFTDSTGNLEVKTANQTIDISAGGAASDVNVTAGDGIVLTAPRIVNMSEPTYDDGSQIWFVRSNGVASSTTQPTALNATTELSACTYTIPANTLKAGSVYKFIAHFIFDDSGVGVGANVRARLYHAGTVLQNFTITHTDTNGTYYGVFEGIFRVQTTGATGTVATSIHVKSLLGGTSYINGVPVTGTSIATNTINTTTSATVEMRIHMNTTGAGCRLTYVHGWIERVI